MLNILIFILEMSRTLSCLLFHLFFSRFTPSHSPHLLHFNFSQVLANFQVSLRIKVGFFNLSSCSSCLVEEIRWLSMWYLRYHFLCMNSCFFMFNWYELREKWKHDLGFVKEKQTSETEHLEHIVVLIFLVLMCLELYFFYIFLRNYTSWGVISALESPDLG